ncbi:exported hypothetical protein [Candidatus Sulfotelmatomonas gaucii]|uniref:Alpha/beta hydrolase family protein n=1 Tax=Candidatus Sulfuritelmatomonas gaucii TaxID=2043161 RepID=A0A2N9LBC5_9BACT|nr:exported hypothetical protein [Candidatus Sulfotelmatomonas gaucii]
MNAKRNLRDLNARVSGASCLRHGVIAAALFLLTLGCGDLRAAPKVLHVDPRQTDPAIEQVHGPHLAVYDPQILPVHRLFVFFPGTGAKAEGSLTIDSAFASWGYHAIGLDYENSVLAAVCAHSQDSACFDQYREAIVTGAPGSEKISVDPANSILNRLEKLLLYLVKTDPTGGWDEFVEAGKPAWSRIVVAGHSQGSGHAAYIGKSFPVNKVLIFSGPQDYLDDLTEPAPWEAEPSATPLSRYFAFLNENDPYNVHHQIANCAVLMGLAKPETLMVAPGQEIRGNYQILINNETERPHGSTLLPEFENVWKYMADSGEEETRLKPEMPPPPPPTPAR